MNGNKWQFRDFVALNQCPVLGTVGLSVKHNPVPLASGDPGGAWYGRMAIFGGKYRPIK
jgi:hypothetical protein